MQVSLRKISDSDTNNIVKWRNSEEVRHWLYSQVELTAEMHNHWLKNVVGSGRCEQYIIVLKDGKESSDIGTTFIKRSDKESEEGEFGIFIGESWAKGKHCSLPATQEMIRIGFESLMLKTIFLTVFRDNLPAVKTYRHAGFRVVDEYDYPEDTNRRVLKMQITKTEYLLNKTKCTTIDCKNFANL